mmetsp:Transcript_73087/g.152578  ORF Transcript_73087/g.152578 Transcript_73087/m.152578 type:complete len:339 (+) Transcript_73087:210-1226(+)|eukprot:CAMPEP_0206444532 /NCGR_PEP_ID=MMETSP0324_2-20121206/14965_1 /ASSEMBLY_ACC=CAM_ASM_000836 /TAXON_ID=2866 /ORGANISM="Crypthecodinium cohnii, Strain Seligo" /LENGTH=338 /DNA_ID=CAMNT_0053912567 /DNA_START=210 /DNA_END=1226 /DNA_ORIENTATION=+
MAVGRRCLSALLLAAVCHTSQGLAATPSFSPVIGILAEPIDWENGGYLEAWYVKWIEAQGARVAPLRFDAPREKLEWVLSRLNGVLLPGGGTAIKVHSTYGSFSSYIFDYAVKNGMPIWGTCLGFEQLMLYSSGEMWPGPLSSGWKSEQLTLPLTLTEEGKTSSLVSDWPASLLQETSQQNVTWHFHQQGVSIKDFNSRPALGKFWRVISTNVDLRGEEFVSFAEARDGAPIFASQFHPEKNLFEFEEGPLDGSNGVHSSAGVDMANRLAQHFVERARHFRAFDFLPKECWSATISAWTPTMRFPGLPAHMPVYFFPPYSNTSEVDAATVDAAATVLI